MTEPALRPEPIIRALQGAFARDASRADLLTLGTTRVHAAGPPYDGAAVYLAAAEGFRLEAHAGTGSWLPLLPADGAADDPASGAVLAMPITLHEQTLGLLVVRSGAVDAFGATQEAAVRAVADALAILL